MSNKVQRLEDLIAWQESKAFSVAIYKLTSVEQWSKDYSLRDQIRRAAVSIPSNIAEGYGRGGNKEFIQFLSIAKGSLYELKTQLIIGKEIGYTFTIEFAEISNQIDKVAKIITGLLSYLKGSEYRGNKFAESEAEYYTSSNQELRTSN
jgi:four helix bundle protein